MTINDLIITWLMCSIAGWILFWLTTSHPEKWDWFYVGMLIPALALGPILIIMAVWYAAFDQDTTMSPPQSPNVQAGLNNAAKTLKQLLNP